MKGSGKMESTLQSFDYIWSADCHGLECLIPYDEGVIRPIKMRHHANLHRHPALGTVCIPQEFVTYVNTILEKGGREYRQLAWFLIAGTKDERATAINKLFELGDLDDDLDGYMLDLLMMSFEFTVLQSPSSIQTIKEYPKMFKNEYFQKIIT